MFAPNISILVVGNVLHFPCSLSELIEKIESQLSKASSRRLDIFLPFVCVVFLFCSLLNSRCHLPRLELRKWQLLHHYWKHFHDWTEEEKELHVSELYTYCRPADYRYPAYSEEIRIQRTTFKNIPKKRTMEFSNLSKGHLHEGWNRLWYERKGKIRLLKRLVSTMTILLVLQMSIFLSLLVDQPTKSVEIHKNFFEEYQKLSRKEKNDRCAKRVREKGDYMTGLMRRVVLAFMKENIGWFSTLFYLLFFIVFSVHLARLSQSIVPPSLPRPLLGTEADKLEHALPVTQLQFIHDYFLHLGLFSGLLFLLNLFLIFTRFKVF